MSEAPRYETTFIRYVTQKRGGLAALFAAGLVAIITACGSATVHRSATAEARLVAVAPGVWVVEDHHRAVFYAEGSYWMLTDGVWYQSDNYLDGYVQVEAAPSAVVQIERPQMYVQYNAPAGAETRPIVKGNGRGRALGHDHAPGLQPDHQTGHARAPGHDKAYGQEPNGNDATKEEKHADKAANKADKAENKAEKKAEIAERKEDRAEALGTKQAKKEAKEARKKADKAEKRADRAEEKADKAEKGAPKAKAKAKAKDKTKGN